MSPGYNEVFRAEGSFADDVRRNRVALARWDEGRVDAFEVYSAYSGEGVQFKVGELDELIGLLQQAKAALTDQGAGSGAPAPAVMDMPRGWFFQAADRQGSSEALLPTPLLTQEKSRRQHLVNDAVADLERLLSTVKMARGFDAMGNIELLLPQINALHRDASKRVMRLRDAVEDSKARYLRVASKPAAVAESTPQTQAAAAPSQTGPRSGPGLHQPGSRRIHDRPQA